MCDRLRRPHPRTYIARSASRELPLRARLYAARSRHNPLPRRHKFALAVVRRHHPLGCHSPRRRSLRGRKPQEQPAWGGPLGRGWGVLGRPLGALVPLSARTYLMPRASFPQDTTELPACACRVSLPGFGSSIRRSGPPNPRLPRMLGPASRVGPRTLKEADNRRLAERYLLG